MQCTASLCHREGHLAGAAQTHENFCASPAEIQKKRVKTD